MSNIKNTQARIIRSEAGFTLTEMLIVIAIIAMVGTFVTGQIINRFNSSKVQGTKIQMRQLGGILDQFKLDCGFYPETDQGLDALVSKPEGGRDCKNYQPGGYIKSLPKDGFGNDFVYTSNGRQYEIISLGSDDQKGGDEIDADISSNKLDE